MYVDIFIDLQIVAKWVLKQGLKWGDYTFLFHK